LVSLTQLTVCDLRITARSSLGGDLLADEDQVRVLLLGVHQDPGHHRPLRPWRIGRLLAVQGVDYPATVDSNASMGKKGGPEMAKMAKKALSQCPKTKTALSGYSQGGMVTHYAVDQAGLSAGDVAAAVLYGDPEDVQAVGKLPSSKVKEFCAKGDSVCEDGSGSVSSAHMSYTSNGDIPKGAKFIIQHIGHASSSGSSKAAKSGKSTKSTKSTKSSATSASTTTAAGGGNGLASLLGAFAPAATL